MVGNMNVKKTLGIGIGVVIAGLGAYKYFTGKEPQKYSNKWFDTVSDEVLKTEREVVRKQFCSAGDDFSLAVRLENLLRVFDSVLSKRAWGDETPHGPGSVSYTHLLCPQYGHFTMRIFWLTMAHRALRIFSCISGEGSETRMLFFMPTPPKLSLIHI